MAERLEYKEKTAPLREEVPLRLSFFTEGC